MAQLQLRNHLLGKSYVGRESQHILAPTMSSVQNVQVLPITSTRPCHLVARVSFPLSCACNLSASPRGPATKMPSPVSAAQHSPWNCGYRANKNTAAGQPFASTHRSMTMLLVESRAAPCATSQRASHACYQEHRQGTLHVSLFSSAQMHGANIGQSHNCITLDGRPRELSLS